MINKTSKHVISWRIKKKYELMNYKGNKCEKCGYNKVEYPNVFHFHHTDGSTKDFQISGKSFSFQKLKEEVDKCQLLCANCHAEAHAFSYQDLYAKARLLSTKDNNTTPKEYKCELCHKQISSRAKHCRVCSKKQSRLYYRPDDEELLKLKKQKSVKQIADQFKVSYKLVYKWLEKAKKNAN